jgi:hypothetical protein
MLNRSEITSIEPLQLIITSMSYGSTKSFYPSQIPLPASIAGISSGYSSGYYHPSATSSQETLTLEEIRTLVDEVLTKLSDFETANLSRTVSEITDSSGSSSRTKLTQRSYRAEHRSLVRRPSRVYRQTYRDTLIGP